MTVTSPNGIPSDAIKSFHQSVLEKALSALYIQPIEERNYLSLFMAIDDKELIDAKEKIMKFMRSFNVDFASDTKRKKVYCLSSQFFCLEEES